MKLTVIAFTFIFSLLFSSCEKTDANLPHINDQLIEYTSSAYTTYYETTDIRVAERTLNEIIEKAEEKKEFGAKSQLTLWEAYFRMAEIHKIKERKIVMQESVTESLKNLEELEEEFRPDMSIAIGYTIDRLREIDAQFDGPKWKEGKSNLLF